MILVTIGIILEIFGFSLALIEIKFNHLADRLENWIDTREKILLDLGQKYSQTIGFHVIGAAATLFVFIMGSWWLIGSRIGNELNPAIWLQVLFFSTVGVATLVVLFYLLAEFIDFLNKFSGGKATGSLGVFIGFISLGIETIGLLTLDCPVCP